MKKNILEHQGNLNKIKECVLTLKAVQHEFVLKAYQSPRGIRFGSKRPSLVHINCNQEFNQIQLIRFIEYLQTIYCSMEREVSTDFQPNNLKLKTPEIQEKENAWHDLTVKPDDLPGHREVVVVKIKFDMYHYSIATYSHVDGMWYLREDDEFYQTNKEIVKWQKINE